jgi:putative SOS response-associated peptidase YedK
VCNLYSVTTNQEAIRRLFRVGRDLTGNLPPLPGIFPDYMAPVVRVAEDGARELTMMRWGMPCPPQFGELSRDEHPQYEEPALAAMARPVIPLHRPVHVILRVRGHEAAQDADLVRA